MSSVSSADHESFLYQNEDSDIVNGFVAGLAGTGLNDDIGYQSTAVQTNTRTVRLSANSTSFEESDFALSHASINEEENSDSELCRESSYLSRFSLSDITGVSQRNDRTRDVTDSSNTDELFDTEWDKVSREKYDVGCDQPLPGLSLKSDLLKTRVERKGEDAMWAQCRDAGWAQHEEEHAVFSPYLASAFGDFELNQKEDDVLSNSSADSFGDFDESLTEVTWKKESRDTTDGLLSDRTRDDINNATSMCYLCHAPNSWMVQSSPKKLLDKNFVWTQARSSVTKPSYAWHQLKLHSFLLGALSVRQPISLNRLKAAGGVHSPSPSSAPTTGNSRANSTNHTATKRDNVYRKESPIHIPTAPHPDATPSANTSSASLPDTLPDVMSPSPGVTLHEYAEDLPYVPELGEQALDSDHDSLAEIVGWDSDTAGSDILPTSRDCTASSKPSVASLFKFRLSTHRRSHSSPIPVLKSLSPPENRSFSSTPGVFVEGNLVKSSSLESPLVSPSYDECHAGRGLSLLQIDDILTIKHEMKSRVSDLSAALILEFQYRGDADHSREVKKAFVSAFLTAEEKRSKGQLASRQRALLPVFCANECPSTAILVLLTQLLNGVVNDTSHAPELLKHYMFTLCKPS